MEQDEPIAGHDRTGEALADPFLPDLARSAGGPRRGQRRTGVDAVSLRPEKLRPVGRRQRGARQQKTGELNAPNVVRMAETISCRRRPSARHSSAISQCLSFELTTSVTEASRPAEKIPCARRTRAPVR